MDKILFRFFAIGLSLILLPLSIWTPVSAQEMTCPEHTPVAIDIKPGSSLNSINLSSKGLIAVAVLTTQGFDASQFSPEMAHLMDTSTAIDGSCQGATAVKWAYDDVNNDDQLDLVFFFRVQDLNLTSASTAATFMAHGGYGSATIHIVGTDTVKVIAK